MVHHLPLGNPIANKINFTRLRSSPVATCNRLFQISSETSLEQLRLMAQFYVGTRPMPKGIGRVIRKFGVFAFHVPSFRTLAAICATRHAPLWQSRSRETGKLFQRMISRPQQAVGQTLFRTVPSLDCSFKPIPDLLMASGAQCRYSAQVARPKRGSVYD
jgi:hypothetical protein